MDEIISCKDKYTYAKAPRHSGTKGTACLSLLVLMILLAIPAVGAADFTLQIFGNADMNDKIDEKDTAYVQGIISGTNEATKLADANYDGKVDAQDVDQIEKIIQGEDKELTIIDAGNRTVTIKKPLNRVVTLGGYEAEIMFMINEQEKIVGIANYMATKTYYKACIPQLAKLPTVGSGAEIDYEKMLSLNPDLIITRHYYGDDIATNLPEPIPVACFDFIEPEAMQEEMVKFGYVFDKKGWEKSYFEDFHDKYVGMIKDRTKDVPGEKIPKVYEEQNSKTYNIFPSAANQQKIAMSGGKLMFGEIKTNKSAIEIDPEKVASGNPDVIIKDASSTGPNTGYDVDDPEKPKSLRDEILNRSELASVNAVKNGAVYVLDNGISNGPMYPVGIAYVAKWLHPDLFEDLNPVSIHQEYLNRIGSNYNLTEHGVFIYPPSKK
ncbi:MAG: ABC transporter substrate-binding protein [Methanothrix sp.]